MASKIRMSKDHDLIDCKPVLWTKLDENLIAGICGHTNKIYYITVNPHCMGIIQDILIGKTGCVEEGCEESHNCLNYHCEYCEASNIKEAYVNMCESQSLVPNMEKNLVDTFLSENQLQMLELILKELENMLQRGNCLPVKEHCFIDWEAEI